MVRHPLGIATLVHSIQVWQDLPKLSEGFFYTIVADLQVDVVNIADIFCTLEDMLQKCSACGEEF